MKKTFRAKPKTNSQTNKDKPLIGKGKILLLLLAETVLVAGVYIAAVQKRFTPVFFVYWGVVTVLLCVFIYLKKKHEYLCATQDFHPESADETAKRAYDKRRLHIKITLLILLPFLFTVIGDTVYVLLLADSDFFRSFTSLFTK